MQLNKNMHNKNLRLQEKVKEEIQNSKSGVSNKNINQLETILKELETMNKESGLALSFPRIIIDSWDFTDQLGMELLDFAELYKKV